MKSGPDESNIESDPFSRMAAVLQQEVPRRLRRPMRRSRPSLSELAPMVAPILAKVAPIPVPRDLPSKPPPSGRLRLPTVIIHDEDPPTFVESSRRRDTPTVRGRRKLPPPPRGIDTSMVLFLLSVSVVVFALGIIALVLSASTQGRGQTSTANAEHSKASTMAGR